MASPIDVLRSRFRGLYLIALMGLGVTFLLASFILSTYDSTATTPPLLRLGIAVTQKLGTDFIALLIFTGILLYAIRGEPQQEIRSTTSAQASRAIDAALMRTRDFIYLGSTGAYNVEYRVPILAKRAAAERLDVAVSFLLPHPYLSPELGAVTAAVGDDAPDEAPRRTLAVALRLLRFRQTNENLTIAVYFIPHASTIRYDVTDELIAMSSPLGGNPFVLFPREAPMYLEIRADLQRSMNTAIAKVSTADESVRPILQNDLELARRLLEIVGGKDKRLTPQMLLEVSAQQLAARYNV